MPRSVSEIIPTGESAGRRRDVLRLLRASADTMSILAIADALGVHPNTVRFHLDVLVRDGQVEQAAPGRKGPGRPPLMFQAVRQMDRGGTRQYRLLAEILGTAIAAERHSGDKARAAGRAWGRANRNRRRMVLAAPRVRSTAWSRCSTSSDSRPSAGMATGSTADRPAALPVPGTRRKPDGRRVPGTPRAHAGCHGSLGCARHRRPARAIRPNRICAWPTSA